MSSFTLEECVFEYNFALFLSINSPTIYFYGDFGFIQKFITLLPTYTAFYELEDNSSLFLMRIKVPYFELISVIMKLYDLNSINA